MLPSSKNKLPSSATYSDYSYDNSEYSTISYFPFFLQTTPTFSYEFLLTQHFKLAYKFLQAVNPIYKGSNSLFRTLSTPITCTYSEFFI